MEFNVFSNMKNRPDFELFKSSVCHCLKKMGDLSFIISILESNIIEILFKKEWNRESFYFLAMLDYLSDQNNISICSNYDYIREYKLEKPIYPFGIVLMSKLSNNNIQKEKCLKEAIPEFLKFNIIESEIRNVY
jgi:hypothetical protein